MIPEGLEQPTHNNTGLFPRKMKLDMSLCSKSTGQILGIIIKLTQVNPF